MKPSAILSALPYVIRNQMEDHMFKVYVTDGLYVICRGGLKKRYVDIIEPKPVDNRTGDEIAEDLMSQMELIYDESV